MPSCIPVGYETHEEPGGQEPGEPAGGVSSVTTTASRIPKIERTRTIAPTDTPATARPPSTTPYAEALSAFRCAVFPDSAAKEHRKADPPLVTAAQEGGDHLGVGGDRQPQLGGVLDGRVLPPSPFHRSRRRGSRRDRWRSLTTRAGSGPGARARGQGSGSAWRPAPRKSTSPPGSCRCRRPSATGRGRSS
jgi:hypothetical protein